MTENGSWKIVGFDSEDTIKRLQMTLKNDNGQTLTVFATGIPSTWKIGDEIDIEKVEDLKSKILISLSNKTRGGKIPAKVADDPDGILKSHKQPENIEYPNLGEDKAQKIIDKAPRNIVLEDGSRWYFHPTTSPLPEEWNKGDAIVIEHAGPYREGDKTRRYNLKNMRLKKDMPEKYEQLGFWENPGEKKPESYAAEKGRKGVIYDKPAGEYDLHKGEFNKFGKELVIQAITEKYIFLSDGSGSWPFRWYAVIGYHGEWSRGNRVVVRKLAEKSDVEAYSLLNKETGKYLTITPAKEDEEEGEE